MNYGYSDYIPYAQASVSDHWQKPLLKILISREPRPSVGCVRVTSTYSCLPYVLGASLKTCLEILEVEGSLNVFKIWKLNIAISISKVLYEYT